jgi:NAD(P)-dependent dehydrogenase (short-subunit alcohol dehydrogenase family)
VGQVVARQMMQQESGGSIINVSSILGIGVQSRQANYAAAKAGVIQLTRSMALELGRRGVRVNAIAPGYIVTGINREFFASNKGQDYVKSLFPGRPGSLDELDGILLLLAGPAGSYIQGATIPVDGGTLLAAL